MLGKGMGGSGVVPPALIEEDRVPKFYTEQIETCGAENLHCNPDTTLVRRMMVASQLSEKTLADIWSLCNRTNPGELTRSEFYSCLALIALAQKGQPLSALCEASTLPIPYLQTFVVSSTSSSSERTIISQPQTPPSSKQVGSQKANNTSILGRLTKYRRRGPAIEKPPFVLVDLTPPSSAVNNSNGLNATNGKATSGSSNIDFRRPTQQHGNNADEERSEGVEGVLQANVDVWASCLRKARSVLREHHRLVSEYPYLAVIEVVEATENGGKYAASMRSIFAVVQRIGRSLAGVAEAHTEVASLRVNYHSVMDEWMKLSEVFCVEREALIAVPNAMELSAGEERCPVCCQHTRQWKPDLPSTTQFLGHTYHTQCANFYLNRVGVVLPQL